MSSITVRVKKNTMALGVLSRLPLFPATRLLPLCLVVTFFIIPFQIYLNLGPAPLAAGYLLTLLGWVMFLPVLIRHRNWKFYTSPLFLPLLTIGVAIVLSLVQVVSLREFLVKTLHLGLQVLFYLLALNILTKEAMIKRVTYTVIIAGAISAFVGILIFVLINVLKLNSLFELLTVHWADYLYGARAKQFFVETPYYSWVRTVPGQMTDLVVRATALFVGPGENCYFSACAFFVTLGSQKIFFEKHRMRWLILLALSLINILLAQTRGVWLGVAVGLGYYVLKYRLLLKPKVMVFLSMTAFLVVVVVISVLGKENLIAQFESITAQKDSSAQVRLITMQQGVSFMMAHTFLVGVGPGNQGVAMGQSAERFDTTTHSMYIDTGVAIGGLGLFAYLWLMLRSFQESRYVQRHTHSLSLQGIAGGYQYMWIAIMVAHITQGSLFGNPKTNLLVWGMMGVISASRRLVKQECVRGLINDE